ncbi:MAG TPA: NUDIX domain-containing protein [Patescibacteria group bacterium]
MENFLGEKQFIASVLITTKSNPKKILLLHHKKAGVWLQPGGHIEHNENPIEAIIRETKEETGLDISEYFILKKENKESQSLPLPRFIQEEKIPEHSNHPFHFHIDLLYHIEFEEEMPVTFLEKEAHAIGWFEKQEALQLDLFEDTKKIIEEIM